MYSWREEIEFPYFSAEYQAYSLEEYCDKIREEMLRLVEEEEVEEGGEGEGEGEDREEGGA